MSKKASTTVIGGFVVGAVALVVAGILIFGGGRLFAKKKKFVLFFDGSVKGLAVGAPVDFRGVRVGSVTDIRLMFDPQELTVKIPVYVELEPNRLQAAGAEDEEHRRVRLAEDRALLLPQLIHNGLRAQLQMQSFVTGQLYVLLDFYPDKPLRLTGFEPGVQEIPTIPTPFQEIRETIQSLPLEDVARKLVSTLEGLEKFVNSQELKGILSGLEKSAQNAGGLLAKVNDRAEPIAVNLEQTLDQARQLLKDANERVPALTNSAEETLKEARGMAKDLGKQVNAVGPAFGDTLKTAQAALKRIDSSLAKLENETSDHSPLKYEIMETLREMTAAARSLRALADTLERRPQSLFMGKEPSGVQ
jgi:paraquat-inducible protein B